MPEELELEYGVTIRATFAVLCIFHERYLGALSVRNGRLHPYPIWKQFYGVWKLFDTISRFSGGSNELGTNAAGLLYDCERVFAGLAHLDARRATWCYFTRRNQCEEVFARFADFMATASSRFSERLDGFRKLQSNTDSYSLVIIGDALWQVTCHVPHSLAPSAPPPPYTLHAFNIELPAMEWPQAQAEDVRLWPKNSGVSCKRTSPKAIQHAIIQNLLQLAAESTETTRKLEEPRVVEVSEEGEEEEEEEGEGEGVPLPDYAWE